MISKLELNYRYDKYVNIFRESDIIKYNGESIDLPTKRAIQDDDFGVEIQGTSVNGSDKLLLANDDRVAGIRYFSPDLLAWLATKLTDVLKANICEDHLEYWWFTHDFTRAYNEFDGLFPEELIDNIELLIRLVTYSPSIPVFSTNREAEIILRDAKTLASYLSYPTLEGFVKSACRKDIQLNGVIKEGRRIRKLSPPNKRRYMYPDDGKGICSNLGMILWHLETEVAHPRNRILLKEMRQKIGDIFDHSPDQVYGLINDFRNNSLHGRNRASREHGVILNLICLIIWVTLT